MLRVQGKMCETCVYRPGSPLDPKSLEESVKSEHGGFKTFRICHSSKDACCAGFWVRHKDGFSFGQIAQRLGLVRLVRDNIDTPISRDVAAMWNHRKTATV